uniref:Uncharacterized protein n=1 Tax=Talaromyces marneffei PM1 TaxID=1077442 RepID=A0A093UVL4_TALMA
MFLKISTVNEVTTHGVHAMSWRKRKRVAVLSNAPALPQRPAIGRQHSGASAGSPLLLRQVVDGESETNRYITMSYPYCRQSAS